MNDKPDYSAQKRYLKKQKQLRVWVNAEKYEAFKQKVYDQDATIYSVINQFIDDFLKEPPKD